MGVDIFGGVIGTLERALDLRAAKHGAILSNLANMDNPAYKGFDVMVEEEMRKTVRQEGGLVLKTTHPGHVGLNASSFGPVSIAGANREDYYSDGKGRVLDRDMAMVDLARNHIMFTAAAQMLGRKLQGLKEAIQDGRS